MANAALGRLRVRVDPRPDRRARSSPPAIAAASALVRNGTSSEPLPLLRRRLRSGW
jgi:hypothetical protein